jgi:transposase InsO family protein
MIDPVTGWFEIAEIPAKTADVVINVLEQQWLVRYPRPAEVIMDRGTEFMGEVKSALKDYYGTRPKMITTRNPQANSMVERAHQTIQSLIQTQNIQSIDDLEDGTWNGVLSAVGFAMRATLHTTMRATPMQLVFGRDAIHNIRFEADWQYIQARRQRVIRQNNERENAKRTPHTYSIGDSVMVVNPQNRKYGQPRFKGPYTVDRVNDNGTVRLRQPKGNGIIYQTWNIRNIHPYKD